MTLSGPSREADTALQSLSDESRIRECDEFDTEWRDKVYVRVWAMPFHRGLHHSENMKTFKHENIRVRLSQRDFIISLKAIIFKKIHHA